MPKKQKIKRRRKFGGKWYDRHSFWNTKKKALHSKEDLKAKEPIFPKGRNSVRMTKGKDHVTGQKGYWLFVRKNPKSKSIKIITIKKGKAKKTRVRG